MTEIEKGRKDALEALIIKLNGYTAPDDKKSALARQYGRESMRLEILEWATKRLEAIR